MERSEILALDDQAVIALIKEKFGVVLTGLADFENLGTAWQVVEKLDLMGWAIDIRNMKGRKTVDAFGFTDGGPVTIFARYGQDPDFATVCEGLCKTALIIVAENRLSGMQ